MDSIDLLEDAFYMCTEVSPRCFVVQKAIDFDRQQIERLAGGDIEKTATQTETPPQPQLPYWFTNECRNMLVNCNLPATVVPTAPSPIPPLPVLDLKQQLKAQLEYYFSRENLITDRYLRCQMDADQYVPISIIAGFRKITQLTNDYNLVLDALRESNQVEVDEKGEKVRPVCRRCTIILREISEEHKEDVEKMLDGGPPYVDLKYGLNNSWYVMYENEETTQKAYLHLQNLDSTYNNKPICARIKAGGPPTADLPPIERAPTAAPDPMQPELPMFTPLGELGQLLGSYGYVPTSVYRPGSAGVLNIEEEMKQQDVQPMPPRNARNTQSPRPTHNGYNGSNGYSGGMHHNGGYNNSYNADKRSGGSSRDGRDGIGGRRNTTGAGGAGRPRIGGERNDRNNSMFQGGRRNGAEPRRRSDYWNTNGPSLSVSANDLNNIPQERPRYHSFRKMDEGNEFLTVPHRKSQWETETEQDENQQERDRKNSSNSGCSTYSFEERAFPSLSDPKPPQEKPAEKPSFSCVAAGRRYAKPEPKKSYAEKLKEKGSRP